MNRELIAALNAERYGTGGWFIHRQAERADQLSAAHPSLFDDSDTTTARRRRDLLAAVDHHHYAKEA